MYIVQAVVKAKCQSNGNGQILTPPRWPKTSQQILMKLEINNYVTGNDHICNNVGGFSKHVTCHILISQAIFLFLLCSSTHSQTTRGPILTINM